MPTGWLAPDRYLTSVLKIEADWLQAQGITTLLLDIDNTLVSRDTQLVSEAIREWARQLTEQGFNLFLVTNNWHRVVFDTAAELGLPIVYKSMKPLPFNFYKALRRLGVRRQQAMVVGDQMMTDVLGARLAGIKVIMVQPLAKTDLVHTKLLRNVEKILLADRQPEDIELSEVQEQPEDQLPGKQLLLEGQLENQKSDT